MAMRSRDLSISYWKGLVAAGVDGIASARREQTVRPSGRSALWTPAAMGAAAGALSARLLGKRKSASGIAVGGLLGSLVGWGAAVAWTSRGLMAPAARGAARRVNALRDAHWLEANPINYA